MKKDMPPEEFVRASWAIVAKAAEDGVHSDLIQARVPTIIELT